MYVYIWKKPDGTPFYVGMGTTARRMKPHNKGNRNKACLEVVQQIGVDNVVVEVRFVTSIVEAQALEQELIALYGRLRDGSGTLTNIAKGGEFHAAAPETREKLKNLWKDPEFKAAQTVARKGRKRKLPESTKTVLRANLIANPAMKNWGERNGKDEAFDAKRVAGIRAAQGRRREKMSDPAALAQRVARLKATMSSPEYLEKRKNWQTPEYRAKLSAAKKAYWDNRKASKLPS